MKKEEVLSGSDFYLGVSLKKFLIFYSYGEGKIFFFFRFKEFWCICILYMYMFVVGNILFFGDFNMGKKIILIGVSLCI